MDSQVWVALALSLVGGFSTSLGALFVILNQAPNLKMLGLLQGFAAGLMLSISFFDLAHNAINSIGFLKGNLWACVESMTAVTNLSNRLQSRTNEVQHLNSQLALLQRMYKDARAEISVLRAENKELKRKATVMFRLGGPPYAAVEEQGVNVLGGVGNPEATSSRAVQDGGKKKRPAAE
ncbi:hypothetical protein TEA_003769 [Camellia sinensis var. sinensis]|uniref:Uncharacterized protein n=1 Tax=Camellia sinensis var. sinensis TaxID=542762 RepID=A0A4S4E4T0_CAMSN|nr:hypothetical protein TEA_003769 [Camellia sinensis var. sinensis]